MDPNVIAIALTVLANVLFLGFIYGRMATRLDSLAQVLDKYVDRTDRAVHRHDSMLTEHGQRLARLEAFRSTGSAG